MKKNKAMRAAGVLMIATLLTTCLTAGTFAKYTTTDTAADTARVAKFGVTVVANGSLFGDAYNNQENGNTPVVEIEANKASVTVKSSDTDKVVAPGTKNESGLGFAVNGKPEVDVELTGTIEAQNIFLAAGKYGVMTKLPANTVTAESFGKGVYFVKGEGSYTKASEFAADATYYVLKDTAEVAANTVYYPVVYKLAGGTSYTNGTTAVNTAEEVAKAVAAKFGARNDEDTSAAKSKYTFSKVVKNNTDLNAELALGGEKITWEWAFNVDNATDAKDTILGDLIAQSKGDTQFTANGEVVKYTETTTDGVTAYTVSAPVDGTDYNLTTELNISITATQVD